MAKMYGFTGRLSGKMGAAVFRVRAGEQVVTQYNPVVANPNTIPQQNGRAKFKLVSQLAVALQTIIVAPVDRRLTARNSFVARNYGLTTLDPDPSAAEKAVIDISKVQLTPSTRPFGTIQLAIVDNKLTATITSPGASGSGRSGKIALVGFGTMGVTKSPYVMREEDITFTEGDTISVGLGTMPAGDYVVLAYGIDQTDAARRVNLGEMVSDDTNAEVSISDLVRQGAASVTATIGASYTVPAGA